MATTDYTGRTIDLFIFRGASFEPTEEAAVTPSLDGQGLVIAGIEKLVQRFGIVFLTEKGSDPTDLEFGTLFIPTLRAGGMRTEQEVRVAFNLAMTGVNRYLRANPSSQADERFASAALEEIIIDEDAGRLAIRVRVTSAAGSSRQILLPVPAVII